MHIIDTLHQYYQHPYGKVTAYSGQMALLLLLLVILYTQAQPIWQNYNQEARVPVLSTRVEPPASLSKMSREVALMHLFGRSPQANAPTQVASHIKVLGIFLAADPKKSSAVLSISDAPEANFWPGDELPGGGTLTEIRPDRVIIYQDGRRTAALFEMESFPSSPDKQNAASADTEDEAPDEPEASSNSNTNNHDAPDTENTRRPGFPMQEWQRFMQRQRR